MSSNVCWMVVIMMQWTGHWILIGLTLWMGPSTHRKCLFVSCSSVSCWTGCVGVCMFSTVIIRTGVCVRVCVRGGGGSFIFPPIAAGSKYRCLWGRKPIATKYEIIANPIRDFLPTQEVEAQLRGKGLFLCYPLSSCPCSSRVLLHDPCFVSDTE